MDKVELERRTSAARAAIREAHGTDAGQYSIDLFISHHLDELPSTYWLEKLSTATPDPAAVMNLLICRSTWGENDLEHFDFTLPGDVTDYVVTVHFDEDGDVDAIEMES